MLTYQLGKKDKKWTKLTLGRRKPMQKMVLPLLRDAHFGLSSQEHLER